jgi:hypothetical protein
MNLLFDKQYMLVATIHEPVFRQQMQLLIRILNREKNPRISFINELTKEQMRVFLRFVRSSDLGIFDNLLPTSLGRHITSQMEKLFPQGEDLTDDLCADYFYFTLYTCMFVQSYFQSLDHERSIMRVIVKRQDESEDNYRNRMLKLYLQFFNDAVSKEMDCPYPDWLKFDQAIVGKGYFAHKSSGRAAFFFRSLTVGLYPHRNSVPLVTGSNLEDVLSNLHAHYWSQLLSNLIRSDLNRDELERIRIARDRGLPIPPPVVQSPLIDFDFSFIENLTESQTKIPRLNHAYQQQSFLQRLQAYANETLSLHDPYFLRNLQSFCENHVITQEELPAIKKLFAHHLVTLYQEGRLVAALSNYGSFIKPK